jgi:L-alanine-DL-glutamate epimerase-like enolase superfamily enzyme
LLNRESEFRFNESQLNESRSPPMPTLPTIIRSVEVETLDLPLLQPFGISGGVQAMANNLLLTVRLADGTIGYGEAAPLPPYNGETQAMARTGLNEARGWLVGRDAQPWRELGEEFGRRSPATIGSARCALEMALLDALGRRERQPLWKFFGGAGTELETDMTITTGTIPEAAEAARAIRARGIRRIKVKVGGAHADQDLERISAIHAAAPDSPLTLDGNAGLSRVQAAALVRGLKARGIGPELLEQWLPKDDLEGARALGLESGWLVAADESVVTAEDVPRLARAGAAQIVNIKLMKAGVAVAMDVAAAARRAGLGLMIGGNVESLLAMTMSACFAAGTGGFRFADLDTPLFLATNPFTGGYVLEGGKISVAGINAGHGTVPQGR